MDGRARAHAVANARHVARLATGETYVNAAKQGWRQEGREALTPEQRKEIATQAVKAVGLTIRCGQYACSSTEGGRDA